MIRPFIINFKNYLDIAGPKSEDLAAAAKQVSAKLDVNIILAPPQPSIGIITRTSGLPVFCQHVDNAKPGATTGYFVPEVAKSFGASGSILNHSEHQLDMETISELVQRLRDLQMTSVVCAASVTEVKRIADIGPDYIAIEPSELIGSGKAVSKEDPAIITNSVRSIQGSNSLVICGAGITHKNDVSKAMELGSNGILVASGIVKASSWYDKIYELASGMV